MDQLPLKEGVYTINGIIHDFVIKNEKFLFLILGMCFEIIHNGPWMFRSFPKPPLATVGDVRESPSCVSQERGARALIMCRAPIISMDGGAVRRVLVSSQGTVLGVDHPLLSPLM